MEERTKQTEKLSEWNNKRVRIFVKNLNSMPIIFSDVLIKVKNGFITFTDRNGELVSINCDDIIQIKEKLE